MLPLHILNIIGKFQLLCGGCLEKIFIVLLLQLETFTVNFVFCKKKNAPHLYGTFDNGFYNVSNKKLPGFFNNRIQKGRKGKRENSGAYKCHKYARELGVQIINIADEIHNKKQ